MPSGKGIFFPIFLFSTLLRHFFTQSVKIQLSALSYLVRRMDKRSIGKRAARTSCRFNPTLNRRGAVDISTKYFHDRRANIANAWKKATGKLLRGIHQHLGVTGAAPSG